ncbi:MAG: tetratricopeptide repeat protein [Bryobacteraceae bacterium]
MRPWFSLFFCLVLYAAPVAGDSGTAARDHADRGRDAIAGGQAKAAEVELRQAVRLSPQEPAYLALLGIALGMQNQLRESDEYLEKALHLDPSDTATRRNLAWNQFQLGQLAPAKANLLRVLKEKPADRQATLVLGMVDEELKEYPTAARLLESVPAEVTQRAESVAALARAYHHLGSHTKALDTLKQLQDQRYEPGGIFLGGQVAAEIHQYEMAASLFESIRGSYPDHAKLGYNLALAQDRAGHPAQAETTLREVIAAGPASSQVYNLLAWCRYKQDDFRGAAVALDQAIALDPGDETNYLDGGMMLLEHRRYEAALDAAEKALQVAPDSYRAHRLKALVSLKMGRVNEAENYYERAVKLNPNDAQAITGLATAQLDTGKAKEAEQTLARAIERLPRAALLYQAYGSMLLWGDRQEEAATQLRAVDLLRRAASLDASLAEPHYQLGKLALREDRIEEARRELEAAVRLDPASSKNHYSLSQAYRKLGRRSDAAREVLQFQSLKAKEEGKFVSVSAAGQAEK